MDNTQIFDEGIGQRIETGIRILNKMMKNIDKAIEFMTDKLGEMEANNTFIMDYEELPLLNKLILASEYDDYHFIVNILKRIKNEMRYNFNSD